MDGNLANALQYLNRSQTLRKIAEELQELFDLKSSRILIEVAEDYERRAAELTGGFRPKSRPHAA
jgi:hypothetical protein